MNIPIKPQVPAATEAPIPSRKKLEIMLANGDELLDAVHGFIKKHSLPYTVEEGISDEGNKIWVLKDTLSNGELWLQKFITVDPDTLAMKDYARKMAKTHHEVLIRGETGTGKELVANSMIGERKGLVCAVNCAGFPEQLIESELFGHEKGAFTGAETRKTGLMTAAKDGILFLDEIGELPMSVQAKLLRSLQEKKIRRVGSIMNEDINCKFVCATHRDLKEMVKEGKFRQDLYARISTLELDIEPLMKRKCDIIPITRSLEGGKKFLEVYETELNQGLFDLSLNVRSLQRLVTRFNVLGKVMIDMK